MKIALCLSGQPRDIDLNYQIYQQNILSRNDVDVFVHTWWDPEDLSHNTVIPDRVHKRFTPDAIEKIKNSYQPTKILVEKPKVWNRLYDMPQRCFDELQGWAKDTGYEIARKYYCNICNSMWYSIMMANLLKEQHSIENGIEYDIVIRTRFDFAPYAPIDFNSITLKDDELVSHHTPGLPYGIAHDWFTFGRTESINVYCGVYNHINSLVKQALQIDGLWSNEFLVKHHLNNNKIKAHYANLSVHGHRGDG